MPPPDRRNAGRDTGEQQGWWAGLSAMNLKITRLWSLLSKYRPVLVSVQLLLSTIMVAFLAGDAGPFIKSIILKSFLSPIELNPWTYVFFCPEQSALASYIMLALCIFLCALLAYSRTVTDYVRKNIERFDVTCLVVSIPLSALFLVGCFILAPKIVIAVSVTLTCLPVLPHVYRSIGKTLVNKIVRVVAILCAALILAMLVIEPLEVVRGPVRLMNEYVDLYGKTLVKGRWLDNKQFLSGLTMNYDWITLLSMKGVSLDPVRARGHAIHFFDALRRQPFNDRRLLQAGRESKRICPTV